MTPERSRAIIAVLVCLLVTPIAHAGQQVSLRWNFVEGETITYRMTMNQETEMPGGMGAAVVENVMTTTWQVMEVTDEGQARVRISTDHVRASMDGPMGNMVFDSAEETPSDSPLAVAGAMVGTGYTVVFDAGGEILAVEDLEAIREQMIASAGSAQSNPMVGQAIGQMASEDGIKNMMRQGFAALPEGPVGPGDTWSSTFDMNLANFGTMVNTTPMTLDRIEERDGRRTAVVRTDGTMNISMGDTPDSPLAGMIELDSSAIVGTMEWDIDNGRFAGSSHTMTMQMNINAGGQQMSTLTVSTIRMEIIDPQ